MIQIGFCDDDLSILSELRVLLDRYRVERNVEITSAAFQSPLELLTEIGCTCPKNITSING